MYLLAKFVFTKGRRQLLSEFLSNVSVAWFIVAFIGESILLTRITAIVNMIVILSIALILRND